MSLPKFKIVFQWSEFAEPREINLRKLDNGYLLGNTFVKDENDLSDYLVISMKNPDAMLTTPQYDKTHEE